MRHVLFLARKYLACLYYANLVRVPGVTLRDSMCSIMTLHGDTSNLNIPITYQLSSGS